MLRGAARDLSARVRTQDAKIGEWLNLDREGRGGREEGAMESGSPLLIDFASFAPIAVYFKLSHYPKSRRTCAHPEMQRQSELLTSIPGVGAVTAALLLAEWTHLPSDAGRRALAAYAGLNPAHNQSGQSPGQTRLSKTGNARLRTGLCLPALIARRHIAAYAALADRLTAKGRQPLQAIAAIRKLLLLAATLLRTGRPYNPAYLANPTALPPARQVPPEPVPPGGE